LTVNPLASAFALIKSVADNCIVDADPVIPPVSCFISLVVPAQDDVLMEINEPVPPHSTPVAVAPNDELAKNTQSRTAN